MSVRERLMLDSNPYDFEAWAVTRVAGLSPNEIKTGDGGYRWSRQDANAY